MHDYVVAISHRDGDHVGSVKVSAASASDAADAGILTMLEGGRCRRATTGRSPFRCASSHRPPTDLRIGGAPDGKPADPSP